jgi:signal transduction histidine kinase
VAAHRFPYRAVVRVAPARRLVELAVVAALVGIGLTEVTRTPDRTGPLAVHAAALVALGVTVAWRRALPLLTTLAGAATVVVQYAVGWAGSAAELVLYLFLVLHAGTHPSARARAVGLGALGVGFSCVLLRDPSTVTFAAALPSLVLFGGAVAVGVALQHRAAAAAAEVAAARSAREEQEHRAAQELALERTRVARELHDVVTHSLSVVVVQAGALRLDAAPADAERLAAIEDTARCALTEMRRLLGVLRGESGTDLSPQPGLDQLSGLVAPLRATGLDVRVDGTGSARPLPPGLDLTAYRVVQEAATNVLNHAAASAVTVVLDWQPDRLVVTVRDDGAPPDRPGGGAGGRGLLGLAERVALYGGSLAHGPLAGRGYEVRAELPFAEVPDRAAR